MKFPDLPRSGFPIAQTIRQIITYLRSSRVVSINGVKGMESSNGTSFVIPVGGRNGGGGGGSSSCTFGEITTWTEGEDTLKGIRGGLISCGDKNFNVANHEVNPATDGDWLVYLEIECESNRDDDDELILSGIKTSSETDPDSFWQTVPYDPGPPVTQYPDNTNPTVATGIGTIIIPLGRLVVDDGIMSFTYAGCGNVTIGQCGGTLSHSRG